MNTQLSVEELLEPLQTVISVVEKKQTLAILSHVLIQLKNNQLTLTTTDMEIEVYTTSKIKSKEEVSFTLYAKDLIDIIKKLDKDVIIDLTIKKTKAYIRINKNTFELNTFDYKEFPILPKIENNNTTKINRIVLKELIENTSFSMGNQDIRAYLNGLYLEIDKKSITVVATDGHRLAVGSVEQKNDLKDKKTVILPRKVVVEISKLLQKNDQGEITICLTDNYFYLISDNTKITSRLIDGNFPNYTQVIPTNYKNTVIINKNDFLNSLYQASIFVDDKNNSVKLLFKNSQLDIFSHSERGQAKTKITTKNLDKEISVSFNIRYLISILEKINTSEVNMVVPDNENKSCLLTAANDKTYQYIVMPVKI